VALTYTIRAFAVPVHPIPTIFGYVFHGENAAFYLLLFYPKKYYFAIVLVVHEIPYF